MGINQFFAESLKAPVRNPRWSWGAVDTDNSSVFLRVWKDHIADGKVRVGYESIVDNRPGFSERQIQIALIRQGCKGYGVICETADPTTPGAREIKRFDSSSLLIFGEIVEESGETFGTIIGQISVESLVNSRTEQSRIVEDVISIEGQPITQTEKEQLILARIGQGKFRNDLLADWDFSCAVTGSRTLCAIRASHIRPWKDCTNEQRLDPANGLPLIASLDALFDKGLISFEDTGKLMVSSVLLLEEYRFFHIGDVHLRRRPTRQTVEYLEFHRRERFEK